MSVHSIFTGERSGYHQLTGIRLKEKHGKLQYSAGRHQHRGKIVEIRKDRKHPEEFQDRKEKLNYP